MDEDDKKPSTKKVANGYCVDGAFFPTSLYFTNLAIGTEKFFLPGLSKELPPLSKDEAAALAVPGRAARDIDVNQTALAYTLGLIDKQHAFKAKDKEGLETTYSQVEVDDDKKTGFSGAIYMNEKGHAIVLYQGMAARTDPYSTTADVKSYWEAEQGRVDDQSVQARALYVRAAEMSKSVEAIGFSMGTMHTNMLAATLGAKVTNMADFGLSPLYATEQGIKNIKQNVVSMRIEGDLPPLLSKHLWVGGDSNGYLSVGHVYADEIKLNRPTAADTIGEVKKISQKNADYFDPTKYPCTGGEQHTSEAYVLAQERVAAKLAMPLSVADHNKTVALTQ